jgi:hypothetical protein
MSKTQELRDRLDEPEPEVWQPKDEPVLTGVVESISMRPGRDGKPPYPVVVVLGEDGRRRVWMAWHSVAKSRLAELRPRVGERLGVKYLGSHATKGYELYKVVVDRPEQAAEVDWSAVSRGVPVDVHEDEWLPPEDEPPF